MRYKYQMHTHDVICSGCGAQTPEELVKALHDGGYSGCVLTNHFKHGNTSFSRALAWEDFVRGYIDGYAECKKAAEKYDLDIIFSIEEGIGGGREILCYGITPAMLLENPLLDTSDISVWSDFLRKNGCLCIQAHPFRQRDYITNPGVEPLEFIDGIELWNSSNTLPDNIEAENFFHEHKRLICTSGGDAHRIETDCLGGIETSKRIKSEADLVKVLKAGTYNIIRT